MIDVELINYAYKGLKAEYNALHKRIEENTIVTKKEFSRSLDELQKGLSAYSRLIMELEYKHPTILFVPFLYQRFIVKKEK